MREDLFVREDSKYSQEEVRRWYQDLIEPMTVSDGQSHTLHYGLYYSTENTSPNQALANAQNALLNGIRLTPESRVLDLGCGVGGTAVHIARTYGASVTGVTNINSHEEKIWKLADWYGVADRIKVHIGDFHELPFDDATFDLAINQESFNYVVDKQHYVEGVNRVLKHGGHWRCIDAWLNSMTLTDRQQELHWGLQHGCRIHPLITSSTIQEILVNSGYVNVWAQDYSKQVLPACEIAKSAWLAYLMFAPPDAKTNSAYYELCQGGIDFGDGLAEGAFCYRLISGTKRS